MSHYDTLGVPRDANPEDIKAAYRRLATRYHPDKNLGDASAGAEAMFKEVQAAYDVLSDPERRKRYDETGSALPPMAPRDQARNLLLQMFQAALELDDDLKRSVLKGLANMKSEFTAKRADVQRRLKRLAKRSGRIKVKTGENLAQMLIEQQTNNLTAETKQIDEALAVNREAFVMLDNYENEVMDPQPPVMRPDAFITFGSPFIHTGTGA